MKKSRDWVVIEAVDKWLETHQTISRDTYLLFKQIIDIIFKEAEK